MPSVSETHVTQEEQKVKREKEKGQTCSAHTKIWQKRKPSLVDRFKQNHRFWLFSLEWLANLAKLG